MFYLMNGDTQVYATVITLLCENIGTLLNLFLFALAVWSYPVCWCVLFITDVLPYFKASFLLERKKIFILNMFRLPKKTKQFFVMKH